MKEEIGKEKKGGWIYGKPFLNLMEPVFCLVFVNFILSFLFFLCYFTSYTIHISSNNSNLCFRPTRRKLSLSEMLNRH